jgi:hypothetical protein
MITKTFILLSRSFFVRRARISFFFYYPVDPRDIDAADPAQVLAERWEDPDHGEEPFVPPTTPRSTAFLGLRGRGEGSNNLEDVISVIFGMVTDDNRRQEFERLNRVDMETAGWPPSRSTEGPEEEGAAGRPFPGLAPAVSERLSTAEHWAFADEFHGWGHYDFGGLVDTIIGRPIWHFWWGLGRRH